MHSASPAVVLVLSTNTLVCEKLASALDDSFDMLGVTSSPDVEALTLEHQPVLILLDLDDETFASPDLAGSLLGLVPDAPPAIVGVTRDASTEFAQVLSDVVHLDDLTLLSERLRCRVRERNVQLALQWDQRALAETQRISGVGSWEWNIRSHEMRWSAETFRILGIDPGERDATEAALWTQIHPDDYELLRIELGPALDEKGAFDLEHRIVVAGRDDDVRVVRQRGERLPDSAAGSDWLFGTIQDVTEQRRAEDEIRHLANYDSLTGLANRRLFRQLLEAALERAAGGGHPMALLFVDLDQFKRINDTLGHSAGDELLRNVAEILRHQIRNSDVAGRIDRGEHASTVSRLGGDEFTILLSKVASAEDAGRVARRILAALTEPVVIEGYPIAASGSIGIAVFPEDGRDVETLVKHADTAMYHAKESGRNNFQFFSKSLNQNALRRLTLEGRLRRALDAGELMLHYQPKLDLRSGDVTGAEALLRWDDEELGQVLPKEIIPVAEETGIISEIGVWALETTCAQIRSWRDEGYEPVPVSVNLSSKHFSHADLATHVTEALRVNGVEPQMLEIEITESVILQDDERTALLLRDLRAIGVRVALDDFGTGYSSLSYLTRFPLDTLKLDRCFVRDVDSDPGAAGVAKAAISMAHSLNLRVVAEGVDSEEQAHVLTEFGCDEIQGFLFAPAVPADEVVTFLARSKDAESTA